MVFFSSRSKEELPSVGDLVRCEKYGPWKVVKRRKSQDTGSVYLDVKAGDRVVEMVQVEATEWWPQLGDVVSISMGAYQEWYLLKKLDLMIVAKEIEAGNCAVPGSQPTATAVKTRFNKLSGRNKLKQHLKAQDVFDHDYPELSRNLYQQLNIVRIAGDMAIVVTGKSGKQLHPLPLCALKVVVKADGRKA